MRPEYRLTDSVELAANRQGRLAAAQRAVLRDDLRWGAASQLLGWGCLGALLGVVFLAVLLALLVPDLTERVFTPLGLLCWTVLAALAVAAIAHQHWPVWQDLRAGQVTSTTGWIVEHGGAYIPYVPEQYLRFLDIESGLSAQDIESLSPGAYRFYYLPHTRWIVSAEPVDGDAPTTLTPVTPQETEAQIQAALDRAFGIGAADRAANDAGRLPSDQIGRAARWAALQAAFWIVGTIIMLGVVFDALGAGDWVFGALIGVFWAAVVFFLLGDAGKLLLDLAVRSVVAVEGTVRKRSIAGAGGNGRQPHWYFDVGDTELEVDHRSFVALVSGLRYRIYYLPRSHIVVGVTLVDLPPPRGKAAGS